MYVPKGRVLLTAAVDQLAEVRRPAGQTNDDGKNAARVELRHEFYSGSMLTTVICPRSGKTYKIRPHHWARDIASIWLKQGECLLTEGLVDPPWGELYDEERVTIFISEHDLQRLVEKQAAKQEYSDQSPPVRLAEAKIESEFKRWREQHPNDYIPTLAEDTEHMKKFGVDRDTVRELRKGYPRRSRGQKKSDKTPNIRG